MEFNNCLLLICFPVAFVMLLLIVGKRIRPRFPVHVTCWFCSAKASVPYWNRNCWDCPECDQYNGFDKDGSYNKPIPAQYDDQHNSPITCQQDEYIGGQTIMCDRCTQNQLLKVKQLANFTPYSENNYDSEVEAFSRHLEKVYKLCTTCEEKVQQELCIQNKALSMRLQNTDAYRSLLHKVSHIDSGEQSIFHSSYTELPYNRYLTASVWFHTISMLCSLTVLIQHISRNGDWQQWLMYIHPMFNILDKHTSLLAAVGLSSGLLSKLCLGKYRLHVIDVISSPLSLLTLLYETNFVFLRHTSSVYYMSCVITNFLACAVCLGINRIPKNQSNISITRTTLDSSSTDKCSSNSFAPVVPMASKLSNHSTEGESLQHRVEKNNFETRDFTGKDSSENEMSSYRLDDTSQKNVDETTSELNSITLGGLPMKQTHSSNWMFSTLSQSNCASNLGSQSLTQNLWSRKIGKARSLLTPAMFRHSSSPDSHRHSPVPLNRLFSIPTTQFESQKPFYLDRPSSTFCSTPLTSKSPNLFSSLNYQLTSSRPGTPIVTSFGVTPFSNIPLSSGTLPCGTLSHASAFHSGRSFFTENQYSVVRPRSSGPKTKYSMEPEKDDDDDSSDITSVSQRCPVDSTTPSLVPECNKVPLWQHAGLIGFVLGGSVVANVVLIVQMIWLNKSESR